MARLLALALLCGCTPAPAGPLDTIALTSSSASFTPGEVMRVSAEARDASGRVLPDVPFTWSSSEPSVATVSEWGVVLGLSVGAARITATSGGVSAFVDVSVSMATAHALAVVLSGGGAGSVTSAPAGIDCGTACAALFPVGAEVTLTATPQAGSRLAFWSGNCAGSATTCALTMSGARQAGAHFAPLGNTDLTVTFSGAGSGNVVSDPAGLDCAGVPCTAAFATGTQLTLTATPAAGSLFDGWSGACSGTGPCTFALDASPTLGAAFSLAPRVLTVTPSGGGTVTSTPNGITCPGACSASFPAGTEVTLTQSAGTDWFFKSWGGACAGACACAVTLSAVDGATVSALFVQHNALAVTLAGTGKGGVTSAPGGLDCGLTCSATFDSDLSVTLTAADTPGTLSQFGGWSGDCTGATPTCTLSMAAARAVTATFDPIPAEVARAVTLGSANDETGAGIAISGGAAFVIGNGAAGGLIARYALPLTANASPVWSSTWPSTGGGTSDLFSGIAASASAVYVAGQSFTQTNDTYGSKEGKPILLKYPLGGSTPAWYSWYILDAYSGGEWFDSVAVSVESGSTYLYTTGFLPFGPQADILYKVVDPGTTGPTEGASGTQSYAAGQSGFFKQIPAGYQGEPCRVITAGGALYLTSGWSDGSGRRLTLDKYDTAGTQTWEQRFTTTTGRYQALTAFGGDLYAVGSKGGGIGSDDFLVERWTTDGSQTWSRSFDRGSSDDQLFGVVGIGSRLYAVGRTNGGTAGGYDAVVLELDPANGDLLSTTLYGGAGDDAARGAATDGTRLYVVGETASQGAGGSDLLLLEMTVPQ